MKFIVDMSKHEEYRDIEPKWIFEQNNLIFFFKLCKI